MTRDVILTSRATRDIDGIYDWISERSIGGAEAWYKSLTTTLESLSTSAEIHALAPENAAFTDEIRQVLFRTSRGRFYRILFTLAKEEVTVLAIRGTLQDQLRPDDL